MADGKPHPIHSPHDRYFKETFSHPEAALDVFRAALPTRLREEAK